MSDVFFHIRGLKTFCSECRHGFEADRQQQWRWFHDEPVACPTCKSLQVLPREHIDALWQDGNPGLGHLVAIILVCLCDVAFFWRILRGAHFSDVHIVLVISLSLLALWCFTRAMKVAVGDLRVQLRQYDGP